MPWHLDFRPVKLTLDLNYLFLMIHSSYLNILYPLLIVCSQMPALVTQSTFSHSFHVVWLAVVSFNVIEYFHHFLKVIYYWVRRNFSMAKHSKILSFTSFKLKMFAFYFKWNLITFNPSKINIYAWTSWDPISLFPYG